MFYLYINIIGNQLKIKQKKAPKKGACKFKNFKLNR